MGKFTKNLVAASVLAATAVASSAAMAEMSANFGATSNYLWRGTSLSGEGPAISGGIDYSHESGAYAGLWQSSEGATGSNETDVYVGYSGEASGVSYDVGYVSYMYPQSTPSADFSELYLSLGYDMFSLGIYDDLDNKNMYLSIGAEFGAFSVAYGSYTFDAGTDYTHIDLGYTINDELSLTLTKSDITGDDDPRIAISYAKSFDL